MSNIYLWFAKIVNGWENLNFNFCCFWLLSAVFVIVTANSNRLGKL